MSRTFRRKHDSPWYPRFDDEEAFDNPDHPWHYYMVEWHGTKAKHLAIFHSDGWRQHHRRTNLKWHSNKVCRASSRIQLQRIMRGQEEYDPSGELWATGALCWAWS